VFFIYLLLREGGKESAIKCHIALNVNLILLLSIPLCYILLMIRLSAVKHSNTFIPSGGVVLLRRHVSACTYGHHQVSTILKRNTQCKIARSKYEWTSSLETLKSELISDIYISLAHTSRRTLYFYYKDQSFNGV
jgi:hypothetical protein